MRNLCGFSTYWSELAVTVNKHDLQPIVRVPGAGLLLINQWHSEIRTSARQQQQHLHILALVFTDLSVHGLSHMSLLTCFPARIPSVLHTLHCLTSFSDKFLYWRPVPPLAEWNIHQPAVVRSWRPIIERIGQIGDRTTVSYLRYWFFFFARFWFFYKILIWYPDVATLMNLKDRATGSFCGSDCPSKSTWEDSG